MAAARRLGLRFLICSTALGLTLVSCTPSDPPVQRVTVHGLDATYVVPDAGGDTFSPDYTNTTKVTITSCSPSHGPFVGGTALTIMGSGFDKKAKVRVGGRGIQVGQSKLLSPTKIVVVTPAGKVGPADVEVSVGSDKVVAKGCFIYDPIYLVPSSGPIQGGTLVEMYGIGTTFKTGMKLQLGGKDFTDVEVVSATKLRAKTPAGSAGWADLSAENKGGKTTVVREAFRYYTSTNPSSGGLGGGPIKGTLTVSVLDGSTRNPIEGAKVVVEDALTTLFTGTTSATGVLVFSKKNLMGPINVTAGKLKFETTTIASFDARDVTIFLFPIIPPSMGPGPPPKLAGTVEGYVVFGGTTGIGSEKWDLVPEPKTGEVKRCYVYGTVSSIGAKVPTAQATATIDYAPTKAKAWPFKLAVVPKIQGIYAIAGLYTKTTDTFVPYAMGVTRGVVVGPGEAVKKVTVLVNAPLTEKIKLTLKDVPTTPIMHKVRVAIDLGADGFIVRKETDAAALGVKKSFLFERNPAFSYKGLIDASYAIDVALDGAGTLEKPYVPYVRGTMRSVQPKNNELVMDKFVGAAKLLDPKSSGTLTNNQLTWQPTGVSPNLAVTLIVSLKSEPIWRIISDGQNYAVKLPDPKTMGLKEFPAGQYVVWAQWMVRIPSYNFNKYNYNHLQSLYWARWSQQQSYFKIPAASP